MGKNRFSLNDAQMIIIDIFGSKQVFITEVKSSDGVMFYLITNKKSFSHPTANHDCIFIFDTDQFYIYT